MGAMLSDNISVTFGRLATGTVYGSGVVCQIQMLCIAYFLHADRIILPVIGSGALIPVQRPRSHR